MVQTQRVEPSDSTTHTDTPQMASMTGSYLSAQQTDNASIRHGGRPTSVHQWKCSLLLWTSLMDNGRIGQPPETCCFHCEQWCNMTILLGSNMQVYVLLAQGPWESLTVLTAPHIRESYLRDTLNCIYRSIKESSLQYLGLQCLGFWSSTVQCQNLEEREWEMSQMLSIKWSWSSISCT